MFNKRAGVFYQGVKSQQLLLECAPDLMSTEYFKNYWFLVSVHPSSFGCMPQVAKHERNARVAQGNSQVRLKLTMNQYCFITLTLFSKLIVTSNPLKAYRHAFKWLHHMISMCP